LKRIFTEMAELLSRGQSFVVTTVFDQSGSAPRAAGAKMLIRIDGSIIGTIGGGRLEADVISKAADVLKSGKPAVHSFVLTGKDAADMDMICGGKGEVLLDFVDSSDRIKKDIYEEAAEIFHRHGIGWLITSMADKNNPQSSQCLLKSDHSLIGSVGISAQMLNEIAFGPKKMSVHSCIIDSRMFLIEPLVNAGTVFIFGAGHVSQRIAPLSVTVGFRTIVLDDRAEFAGRERFPAPVELVLLESFEKLPQLEIDEDSYIAIVTRGHLYDRTVLASALKTAAGYIGMIGSRRKRDAIFSALADEGFTRQDLDRVYSPIGTDIGAETPEELAVSIVGELIKVRAAKLKCPSGKK